MGDLSSVEYGFSGNDACGKCGMKEKKGCCHTDYKIVKLQDAHQLAKTTIAFSQYEVDLHLYADQYNSFINKLSQISLRYHSLPDQRVNSVYLHNCVFRI